MNGNVPGSSTRQMASERHLIRQKLAILAFIALTSVVLGTYSLPLAIGVPLALAGLWAVNHYFLGWMDLAHRREKQALSGAEAEAEVGAILNRLPGNCQVFHDVQSARGNIDHLVVRQDGAIFVIETKSHRGNVSIERCELRRDHRPFEKNLIGQSLDNVTWVKKFMLEHLGFEPRWIHCAIVFTRAHVPLRCSLSHVHIIRPAYLERWLTGQPGDAMVARELWPAMDSMRGWLGGRQTGHPEAPRDV
jgi:hypothetical protein